MVITRSLALSHDRDPLGTVGHPGQGTRHPKCSARTPAAEVCPTLRRQRLLSLRGAPRLALYVVGREPRSLTSASAIHSPYGLPTAR